MQSSDASDLDMSKLNHEVLPLNEKLKLKIKSSQMSKKTSHILELPKLINHISMKL